MRDTNDRDELQCLTCPLCGTQPHFMIPQLTPWFCPNEDCDALAWDPYSTLAENLMDARHARVFIDGVEEAWPDEPDVETTGF